MSATLELPRSYMTRLKHGSLDYGLNSRNQIPANKTVDEWRRGEWAPEYRPGDALALVQVMVRNNWATEDIISTCLDKANTGTYWLRRQSDPKAAVLKMITKCNQDAKPVFTVRGLQDAILTLVSTGERMTQAAIVKGVGNAKDGYTIQQLRALVAAGALDEELEPHGKVTYRYYTLAVEPEVFASYAESIRMALAKKLNTKPRYYRTSYAGLEKTTKEPIDYQAWMDRQADLMTETRPQLLALLDY